MIVAGYADSTIKMFDLKSGDVLYQFAKPMPQGEQVSVICIDHHPNHSIIATGHADGTVKLYNTQSGKVFNFIGSLSDFSFIIFIPV